MGKAAVQYKLWMHGICHNRGLQMNGWWLHLVHLQVVLPAPVPALCCLVPQILPILHARSNVSRNSRMFTCSTCGTMLASGHPLWQHISQQQSHQAAQPYSSSGLTVGCSMLLTGHTSLVEGVQALKLPGMRKQPGGGPAATLT